MIMEAFMNHLYPTAEDWYEHCYKRAIEEHGKDSTVVKMYADKLERIRSGADKKSVAEVFRGRPLS